MAAIKRSDHISVIERTADIHGDFWMEVIEDCRECVSGDRFEVIILHNDEVRGEIAMEEVIAGAGTRK